MSIMYDHLSDDTPRTCGSGDTCSLVGFVASVAASLLIGALVWVALDASPSTAEPCRRNTGPALVLAESDVAALICTSDVCWAQLSWRSSSWQIAAEVK